MKLYMFRTVHLSIIRILFTVHSAMVQGVLISPYPDQEGKKLQRQNILVFIYPIYYHNWRNISSNKISIKRNILTIKQIHREVGRIKDLSAPQYMSY